VSIIGTDLEKARSFLQRGQLVAIPTETVYGLAANALDTEAVLSIFEAKKRPSFDPLIVHSYSLEALREYVGEIPPQAQLLAERFWPGPITLLLEKKPMIPDLVTSGLPTVAVRVPDHPLTLQLLRSLDFPLAAPSANPFGYISPTTAQHVVDQLGTKIEYVLDGGPARVGIESTIIGFPEGVPTVVRLGGLQLEDIEAVIGEVKTTLHSSSNPMAPGMLKSHYAPGIPLRLMAKDELLAEEPSSEIGYLFFEKPAQFEKYPNALWLSESGDFREAAFRLFASLRQMDQLPVQEIWAEKLPEQGLGRAINDRLLRASVRVTDSTHS
jgi:L-threonylcarbamoyladenylate synthase